MPKGKRKNNKPKNDAQQSPAPTKTQPREKAPQDEQPLSPEAGAEPQGEREQQPIRQPNFDEQNLQEQEDQKKKDETEAQQEGEEGGEPVSPRPASVPVKQRVEEIEERELVHKAKSAPTPPRNSISPTTASPAATKQLRPQGGKMSSASPAPASSERDEKNESISIPDAALQQVVAQSKKQQQQQKRTSAAAPALDEDDASPPASASFSSPATKAARPKSAPVAKPVTITTTTTVSTTTTTTTLAPIALDDKAWHPRQAWAADSFNTIVTASLDTINAIVLWVWGLYCFIVGVVLTKLLGPTRVARLSKLLVFAFAYFIALPVWITFWLLVLGRSLRHPIAAIGAGVHIATSVVQFIKQRGSLKQLGRGLYNKGTAAFTRGVNQFNANLIRWNRATGPEIQSQ